MKRDYSPISHATGSSTPLECEIPNSTLQAASLSFDTSMGFSIPDSPGGQSDAATQWSGPTLAPSRTGLREGFRQSLAARRRNAIVPGSLSFDALGSPRSPFVFMSQEDRQALVQREEQGREQQTRGKAVPSIRRHGDHAENVGAAQNVQGIP
ncbi:hypothetical protein PR002_g18680 [Phytophthora rubi]|uniref:Uncharacterized protein n=1 Tax=Phytophthora rubi TaxID=129364 RepID=A0A6A3JXT2_9STRA|nr:hypothetical protein PR002_g18680 [Phytophthora rubi]